MEKKTLPLAAMGKLLQKGGAHRISQDAKEALRMILEEKSIDLAKKAWTFAEHSGRKTVKADDVKLADKQ